MTGHLARTPVPHPAPPLPAVAVALESSSVSKVGSTASDLDGCRAAHARLATAIADLTDDAIPQSSLLPSWTVGHVLTHLARNAEAMCRRIDAAARGEMVEQYDGGATGRAAAIDAGACRPAAEIVRDVLDWAAKLDETFSSLSEDTWSLPVRTVGGHEHPIALLPFRRWREVEVHLVDLGIGITPDDWPPEFIERITPRLLAGLPDRSDPHALAAWLLDRGPAPDLDPWG